jgi:hypothetical protein
MITVECPHCKGSLEIHVQINGAFLGRRAMTPTATAVYDYVNKHTRRDTITMLKAKSDLTPIDGKTIANVFGYLTRRGWLRRTGYGTYVRIIDGEL